MKADKLSCPYCGQTLGEHKAGVCLDAWLWDLTWGDVRCRPDLGSFYWADIGAPIPHVSTEFSRTWILVEGRLDLLWVGVGREGGIAGQRYDAICYNKLDQSDRVQFTEATAPLALTKALVAWLVLFGEASWPK